ncbi:MAG: glycosyltransferase family 4 protein [Chloroflexaceae bacterium]|nr:glycosyltransferase family 4 protein [Chloroflexaceae bacterium]
MIQQRIPVMQLVDGFATEEQSGGAATVGIQLALHLDRRRYAPFVCGLWYYGTGSEQRWREQLHARGIGTAILLPQRGRIEVDMVRAAGLLASLLTQYQPRILHSHFERGDLLGLYCKLTHPTHPRIVRTMHADQQWQDRPWLGVLMNVTAFPWWFDTEIAISRATEAVMNRRIAARLVQRRAFHCTSGISGRMVERLATAPRRQRRSADEPARLIVVGRIEPQKGHHYLLQALVHVLEEHPTTTLHVVGTGSLLAEMQQFAATLGIAHAVEFLGQRSDVEALLLKADLFVSASLWEGFPLVLLEAMAARLPVVATDVSGSRELVRTNETGMLVPMCDPAALAAAISTMLRQPLKAQQMAERASHEIRRYTMEAVAARHARLYESLLER